MASVDICIRNARLRHTDDAPLDIVIAGGRIVGLERSLSLEAGEKIDAGGGLVTPSYVNPHLHLCKVWTLPMMAEEALKAYRTPGMADSAAAIDLASIIKEKYDASWITGNARRAVAMAALYGNMHIRAFADVDRKARLEGVKALLAVREEFRGIVDIQVVAFAQDGIVREPGADRLMGRPWRWVPTSSAAFPGLSRARPRQGSTSGSASILPKGSERTFRCCSTMSAIPTCARWK
jgi:cytosine/creatinine deaminase